MFRRLLVANRGEIALRVLRTARELDIEVVAVYSDADRNALHVRLADQACRLGPPPPRDSYLRIDRIVEAAQQVGADAVHPGYGFLAENADFAEAVAAAGITLVGPSADAIRAMGDKISARRIAALAGVPVVPGIDKEGASDDDLIAIARSIGFPVLLKAAAGGGGKGIRIVNEEAELSDAARLVRAEAAGAFGDDRIYLEKLLLEPRHIEIQLVADAHGDVVTYGERECSVQRRHQKIVEECPSAALTDDTRQRMEDAAVAIAKQVGYLGAGTVEFMFSHGEFYFLEMNTRLQVEHAITEELYGVDLVAEQLRVAAGEQARPAPEPRGHSIEVRVNAEDPDTFFPILGTIERLGSPGGPGVRFDSAVYRGLEVTPYYDSMLAKVIVRAGDRDTAIERMLRALAELRIGGVTTSIPVAVRALRSQAFQSGAYDTSILESLEPAITQDMDIIAVAAALAKHEALTATASRRPPGRASMSPWMLSGRVDRQGQ